MDDATDLPSEIASTNADTTAGADVLRFARRAGIVLALIVLAVAVFQVFTAVTDVIQTWLEPRWVPVWRAIFALSVASLAVLVVLRLARSHT